MATHSKHQAPLFNRRVVDCIAMNIVSSPPSLDTHTHTHTPSLHTPPPSQDCHAIFAVSIPYYTMRWCVLLLLATLSDISIQEGR